MKLYVCYARVPDVPASQLAQSPIHSGHVPIVSTRSEGSVRRLPGSSEDSANHSDSNHLPSQKRLGEGSHSHQRLVVVVAAAAAAAGVEVASVLAVAVVADAASSVDVAATPAAAVAADES